MATTIAPPTMHPVKVPPFQYPKVREIKFDTATLKHEREVYDRDPLGGSASRY